MVTEITQLEPTVPSCFLTQFRHTALGNDLTCLRETEVETDRQTDRQAEGGTDKQTDRQTDREVKEITMLGPR